MNIKWKMNANKLISDKCNVSNVSIKEKSKVQLKILHCPLAIVHDQMSSNLIKN